MAFLTEPWPWYVAGPLIGLVVPIVYLYAGRKWGVSSTFRDICAATAPRRIPYFQYPWKEKGAWRLTMAVGLIVGGLMAAMTASTQDVAIAQATRDELTALGLTDLSGLVPAELFSWGALGSVAGATLILGGGFLVGFGARYADGCTSGHAISGLANLRAHSLVAVLGFFAGGLVATHVLLPVVLGGLG